MSVLVLFPACIYDNLFKCIDFIKITFIKLTRFPLERHHFFLSIYKHQSYRSTFPSISPGFIKTSVSDCLQNSWSSTVILNLLQAWPLSVKIKTVVYLCLYSFITELGKFAWTVGV